MNNRKSSLRTRPHYLRPQVLANMHSLKGRTEMKLEIKELKNSYLAREMVSQVQMPKNRSMTAMDEPLLVLATEHGSALHVACRHTRVKCGSVVEAYTKMPK